MCGIFGILTPRELPCREMVLRACKRMRHRGPDAEGVFLRETVALGHTRLSILDLSSEAAQPMHSKNGRYTISYNGEVYNHRELRAELEAMGYSFSTTSDTETILYAYAAWGKAMLSRLNGMFAFAVADFERKEVFLARDPFGVKPLVYRTESEFFAFSSELPPLANLPELPTPETDPAAVSLFFRYQFIPSPYTIYKNIRKLPPAHCMRVSFTGEVREIERYRDFQFSPVERSEEEAVRKADELIRNAVIANTLSDVPIGVFLSGGIDSTLVAMNLAKSVSRDIPAFTIAFSKEEYSELSYAKIAAEKLGLTLNVEYVEAMALDKLIDILSFYGEPYGDSSVLPTWHVAELARKHVTVSLSGDGGDELFGGYHSYASWLAEQRQNHMVDALRSMLRLKPRATLRSLRKIGKKSLKTVDHWHHFIQYYTPPEIEELLLPPYKEHAHLLAPALEAFKGKEEYYEALDLAQLMDTKNYMPECILPKVDITSMQHSLEVRPALLDPTIADFAFSLSERDRYTKEEGGKRVLKKILLQNGFDESFVFRRKQGFGIPVKYWFLKDGHARKLLEELLSLHRAEIAEYINIPMVRRYLDKHSLHHDISNRLWLVLAFAVWVHNKQKER